MSSGTGIKTSRPVKHYKPASGKEVLIYNNSYIVLLLYTWINPISHCSFHGTNHLYLKEGMAIPSLTGSDGHSPCREQSHGQRIYM